MGLDRVDKQNIVPGGITPGCMAPDALAVRSTPPEIVTLVGCQEDETWSPGTGVTIAADTVNYKVGDRGTKFTMTGPAVRTANLEPFPTDPIRLPPTQAICYWVHIPDQSNFSPDGQIGLYISTTASHDLATYVLPYADMVDGWNLLRVCASHRNLHAQTPPNQVHRMQMCAVTKAAETVITFGHVWAECPAKGKILIVNDGCYETFAEKAYPDLLARHIPVTWAPDPDLLGTTGGGKTRISAAELRAIVEGDNGDVVSFHGWDGSPTQSMTEAQIRADTIKAIKWLQQQGHPAYHRGRCWRAAWPNNLATNHAAIQKIVPFYATPTSKAGCIPWPLPTNSGYRWDIPRFGMMDAVSEATLDGICSDLRNGHYLIVIYLHGISGEDFDASEALWAMFVEKLDSLIADDVVEFTTLDRMLNADGALWRQTLGVPAFDHRDAAGAAASLYLP